MKKMVNGILINMTAEEIAARQEEEELVKYKDTRPIATGKGLVSSIEKAFTGQPFELRMKLQALFAPIKNTLESETCNPLPLSDYQSVLSFLDSFQAQLTPAQITLFKNLLAEFMNNHQFFDKKI